MLWLAIVALAIPFFLSQGDHLTGGGFAVPGSDSDEVERLLQEQVPPGTREVVLAAVLTREGGVPPSALRGTVADLGRATAQTDDVALPRDAARAAVYVAKRHPGEPVLVPLVTGADEYHAPDVATELRERLGLADGYERDGVTMHLVGQGALWAGMVDLTKDDLADAELVGFPIVLVILLLVFGSLSAALLPLTLGAAAVAITGALIYWLSTAATMNVYSTNMASMIGIGVAVDYSLFVLVRYREELRAGRSRDEARLTALTTSGVAIVFSGLTVIVALASLFVIETAALRSLAAGAIIVVAVSVLLTATLLPALIGLLGERITPWSRAEWSWLGTLGRARDAPAACVPDRRHARAAGAGRTGARAHARRRCTAPVPRRPRDARRLRTGARGQRAGAWRAGQGAGAARGGGAHAGVPTRRSRGGAGGPAHDDP